MAKKKTARAVGSSAPAEEAETSTEPKRKKKRQSLAERIRILNEIFSDDGPPVISEEEMDDLLYGENGTFAMALKLDDSTHGNTRLVETIKNAAASLSRDDETSKDLKTWADKVAKEASAFYDVMKKTPGRPENTVNRNALLIKDANDYTLEETADIIIKAKLNDGAGKTCIVDRLKALRTRLNKKFANADNEAWINERLEACDGRANEKITKADIDAWITKNTKR